MLPQAHAGNGVERDEAGSGRVRSDHFASCRPAKFDDSGLN